VIRGLCKLVALAVVAVSCAHGPRPAPPPKPPEAKKRVPRAPAKPEWFWEPVEADVRTPTRKPIDLPVAETAIARVEGAARVWRELPAEARERLRRDGILVVGDDGPPEEPTGHAAGAEPARSPATRTSMGAFYTDLRARRVPHVITLDALYAIVHLVIERTLAEVEELEIAPTLESLLDGLEARLRAEHASVGAELDEAYRVARGLIAVAQALAVPAPSSIGSASAAAAQAPAAQETRATNARPSDARVDGPANANALPPDLVEVVAQERGRIEGHAGVATSPLLGVSIDYARFAVPSSAARPGLFRALAWLGAAPLNLVARTEAPGATVSVAQARVNARAAMLLARACTPDVDPSLNTAYTRLLRLLAFVWGASDDLSLVDIDDLATTAGVDLTKPEDIANVVRVDKVRARALAGRAPAAYDGSGIAGRAGIGVRVFGGHAPIDSVALQSLVGEPVGLAREEAATASIDRLRKGQRVLPSTLDIAAWLGAREARAALREEHADAFDTYDAALANAQTTRPSAHDDRLHASLHGTLLDSLLAWANERPAPTPAIERAHMESILSAWTLLRHSGQVLSRTRAPMPWAATELRVSGAPLPVFVEPQPEVIARLVGAVRQTRRGLEALTKLPPHATALLVETEDMLRAALKGAERHASDEPLTPEETAALASLPARMERIEGDASAEHGPVVAVVYSDPPSRRVLAAATGPIEPVLMLAREADKDDPLLVVGAHVGHWEIIEGFETAPGVMHGTRPVLTDASWRARLQSTPPPRATWTTSFRWARPQPPPPDAPAEPGKAGAS
jgi:hypothetical protein